MAAVCLAAAVAAKPPSGAVREFPLLTAEAVAVAKEVLKQVVGIRVAVAVLAALILISLGLGILLGLLLRGNRTPGQLHGGLLALPIDRQADGVAGVLADLTGRFGPQTESAEFCCFLGGKKKS